MRGGKQIILATKPYAKESVGRSWFELLLTMVLLAASMSLSFADTHFAIRVPFSVLSGIFLLRLFVIYHDQQHGAILSKSGVASRLMPILGCLMLSPSSIWTVSHNHHHNRNSKLQGSNIGSFPVMTKDQFTRSTRSQRFFYLFTRHPLTILFGYLSVFLYGMCINPFLMKPRVHLDCLAAVIIHTATALLLFVSFGWDAWLFAHALPFFVSAATGSYLFYAQHNFPEVEFYDRQGWTYEKAAMQSSSFMKTGKIVAWLTGYIGYHHIHHLNARIPFYRLPETLAGIPELQFAKTTSLSPGDIIRCLRLKVWDTDILRMVPVA